MNSLYELLRKVRVRHLLRYVADMDANKKAVTENIQAFITHGMSKKLKNPDKTQWLQQMHDRPIKNSADRSPVLFWLDDPKEGYQDWIHIPIRGWILPPASCTDIEVFSENCLIGRFPAGSQIREDLHDAYPAIPFAEKGGFYGCIQLPAEKKQFQIDVFAIGMSGKKTKLGSRMVQNILPDPHSPPKLHHFDLATDEGLHRSQFMKRDQITGYQEKLLRHLISYSYHHIPYYHQLFDANGILPADITTFEDLKKIPVLTKRDAIRCYDQIVNPHFVHKTHLSGGTTGLRFQWAYSKDWSDLFGRTLWRGFGWAGLCHKSRVVSFYSVNIGTIVPCHLLLKDAFNIEKIDRDLAMAREFKPDFAYCYASSAYLVARYLQEKNLTFPLEGVITTSDRLFPHYRKTIESAFECEVFDNFGCNDGGAWGAECPEHSGFHHDFERSIIEFEREGRMLVTDLWNYAMPLIRYENGDTGCWLSDECPCGRKMPLFQIRGRMEDYIILSHSIISPTTVSILLRHPALRDIRFIQDSPTRCLVQYEPAPGFSQQDCRDALSPVLNLLDGCSVEILSVDSIERPSSGKQRVVENRSRSTIDSVFHHGFLRDGDI